jgi:hypothetical protein
MFYFQTSVEKVKKKQNIFIIIIVTRKTFKILDEKKARTIDLKVSVNKKNGININLMNKLK